VDAGEEDASNDDVDDEKKKAAAIAALPPRPVKRARTAYFIFADEMRAKIQAEVSGFSQTFSVCKWRNRSISQVVQRFNRLVSYVYPLFFII
jgi:hypothetical protein